MFTKGQILIAVIKPEYIAEIGKEKDPVGSVEAKKGRKLLPAYAVLESQFAYLKNSVLWRLILTATKQAKP